jgi:hypothetical protein
VAFILNVPLTTVGMSFDQTSQWFNACHELGVEEVRVLGAGHNWNTSSRYKEGLSPDSGRVYRVWGAQGVQALLPLTTDDMNVEEKRAWWARCLELEILEMQYLDEQDNVWVNSFGWEQQQEKGRPRPALHLMDTRMHYRRREVPDRHCGKIHEYHNPPSAWYGPKNAVGQARKECAKHYCTKTVIPTYDEALNAAHAALTKTEKTMSKHYEKRTFLDGNPIENLGYQGILDQINAWKNRMNDLKDTNKGVDSKVVKAEIKDLKSSIKKAAAWLDANASSLK